MTVKQIQKEIKARISCIDQKWTSTLSEMERVWLGGQIHALETLQVYICAKAVKK
jgi:hypothetical protein